MAQFQGDNIHAGHCPRFQSNDRLIMGTVWKVTLPDGSSCHFWHLPSAIAHAGKLGEVKQINIVDSQFIELTSDTPRTDNESMWHYMDGIDGTYQTREIVLAEFARRLERELNASQLDNAHEYERGRFDGLQRAEKAETSLAELEEINFQLSAGQCLCVTGDEYGNAYCKIKKEAEILRAALREILNPVTDANSPIASFAILRYREIARAAIALATTNRPTPGQGEA